MLWEAIFKEEETLEKTGVALTLPQYGLKAARRAPQFSKR
jgi:ribosomal protein S9